MANFIPGEIVTTFTTRKEQQAVIRYPRWEDIDIMTEFINNASQEDTFITFSKESISKEEESEFLLSIYKGMEFRNKIQLFCFIDDQLVGTSSMERNEGSKTRSRQVATFGLLVDNGFRGEGIGRKLATAIIEETKKRPDINLIILCVYEPNILAQNLYKTLGFEECGRVPKGVLYKEEYIDEIKMFLNI